MIILTLVSIASISNISQALVGARRAGVGVGVGRGVGRGVVGRPVARAAIASEYSNGQYATGQSGIVKTYPSSYRGGVHPVARGAAVRSMR
jgi:hypothetical protein